MALVWTGVVVGWLLRVCAGLEHWRRRRLELGLVVGRTALLPSLPSALSSAGAASRPSRVSFVASLPSVAVAAGKNNVAPRPEPFRAGNRFASGALGDGACPRRRHTLSGWAGDRDSATRCSGERAAGGWGGGVAGGAPAGRAPSRPTASSRRATGAPPCHGAGASCFSGRLLSRRIRNRPARFATAAATGVAGIPAAGVARLFRAGARRKRPRCRRRSRRP